MNTNLIDALQMLVDHITSADDSTIYAMHYAFAARRDATTEDPEISGMWASLHQVLDAEWNTRVSHELDQLIGIPSDKHDLHIIEENPS